MFEQKISVKEETPNAFIVYDCTGKYSTPGYRISDIDNSTLYVQTPEDTQSYPHTIDVTGTLPNEEELGLEIVPSQVGFTGNEMAAGLYKFKLETTFNIKGGLAQKTTTSYYSCIIVKSLQCCIEKLTGSLDKNAFKDLRQKKAIELNALFVDVLYQIELGRYDQASTIIEYLKSQCKCPGC